MEAGAVNPQDSAAAIAPTALPDDIISAADAEYLLLSNIYRRTSPSVVNIEAVVRAEDGSASDTRRGSGFIYDRQGHVITNAHLVSAVDSITVTLRNAFVLPAELLGLDSFSDLAVLKVAADAERLAPLRIGESASVTVGQRGIVIGNPFGLSSSMTTGIVSGLGRTLPSAELVDAGVTPGFDNPSIIQIDVTINPGSSGGPLLDSQGLGDRHHHGDPIRQWLFSGHWLRRAGGYDAARDSRIDRARSCQLLLDGHFCDAGG